jgi:hypothetical protein
MTTRTPTPRTDAIWKTSIDDTGCVTRMEPIWNGLVAMELEIIDLKARLEYFEKRAEKAENELIDLKLFGKTQPK